MNRWLVAYTLIHNPGLVQCTANNLSLERENLKNKRRKKFINIELPGTPSPDLVQPGEGVAKEELLPLTPGADEDRVHFVTPETPPAKVTTFVCTDLAGGTGVGGQGGEADTTSGPDVGERGLEQEDKETVGNGGMEGQETDESKVDTEV